MWKLFKKLHHSFHNIVMGHSSSNSEHSPNKKEKIAAQFIAGTIVSIFQLLISIFSTIFRTLGSLV